MERKHTPGPWTYGPPNDDGHRFVFTPPLTDSDNQEAVIAELWQCDEPRGDADARLIASAPELLAFAVRFAIGNAGTSLDYADLREQARAAIAKATGAAMCAVNADHAKRLLGAVSVRIAARRPVSMDFLLACYALAAADVAIVAAVAYYFHAHGGK